MFPFDDLLWLPYPLAHTSFKMGTRCSVFIFYKLKCTVTAETWWEMRVSPSHRPDAVDPQNLACVPAVSEIRPQWELAATASHRCLFSRCRSLRLSDLGPLPALLCATHKTPAYTSSFEPVWWVVNPCFSASQCKWYFKLHFLVTKQIWLRV